MDNNTIQPSPWQPGEVHGMKIARRPIFAESIDHDGWPQRMLHAIATAKALGITMFEIDGPDPAALVAYRQAPSESRQRTPLDALFYQPPVEGDEWKSPRSKRADRPVPVVTVYAVVVE